MSFEFKNVGPHSLKVTEDSPEKYTLYLDGEVVAVFTLSSPVAAGLKGLGFNLTEEEEEIPWSGEIRIEQVKDFPMYKLYFDNTEITTFTPSSLLGTMLEDEFQIDLLEPVGEQWKMYELGKKRKSSKDDPWRQKISDRRKEYMKEYMKKYRETASADIDMSKLNSIEIARLHHEGKLSWKDLEKHYGEDNPILDKIGDMCAKWELRASLDVENTKHQLYLALEAMKAVHAKFETAKTQDVKAVKAVMKAIATLDIKLMSIE